jgi:hypothetical protein
MALKHAHISELFYHVEKQDSAPLSADRIYALADAYFYSKPFGRIVLDIQRFQKFHLSTAHPKELLFVLAKLGIVLLNALKSYPSSCTNVTIESIEKIGEDWFWDLQVPNTNNYVSTGLVHHNSAKSTIAAHLAVTHCLFNSRARVLLARRALPDLKRTIYLKIIEHISQDLVEGRDYTTSTTQGWIRFSNGSEIISGSWADKRYLKFRSLDLSAAIFEELIENEGDDVEAYKEIKNRVGRLPHIKENFIVCCTNPGSPSSFWYKYFILGQNELRRVMYSLTTDNPFLPKKYINQLLQDMDPKVARRMLFGEWLEIAGEVIYYAYSREQNYRDYKYTVDLNHPIHFSYDFNIGEGKPMSVIFYQIIDDVFHFFEEVVVFGSRTQNTLDEAAGRGLFNYPVPYFCHGDAFGDSSDTRYNKTDYEIIDKFCQNYEPKLTYKRQVLKSNPPIRSRHNLVNAYCRNALGQIRFYVYNQAKTLDEGMRLTKLKRGADYLEDDSKHYQHITTAAGYGINYHHLVKNRKTNTTIQL